MTSSAAARRNLGTPLMCIARTLMGRRAKNAWALEESSSPALAAGPATRGSQRASDSVTSQGRPTKSASSAPIAITASYHLALRDFKPGVVHASAPSVVSEFDKHVHTSVRTSNAQGWLTDSRGHLLKQPMLILFFFLYSDRVTSPFCSFCVFLGHRMQSANSAESGFVDKRHSSRSADEMPIRLIERGVRRCWARVAQAVRLTALATSQTIRGTEFADRCKMCHSVPGVAVGPGLTGGNSWDVKKPIRWHGPNGCDVT